MKSKILVPIQDHKDGLHEGHRRLIQAAKGLGNPLILIAPNLRELADYFLTGRKITPTKGKTEEDLNKIGVESYRSVYAEITESERLDKLSRAKAYVNLYNEFLCHDMYKELAVVFLMSLFTRESSNYGIFFRGPEVINFFLKHICKLFEIDVCIYKEIVRDEALGVKASGRLGGLKEHEAEIARIPHILGGCRSQLKIGSNLKLTEELNVSYGRPWKLIDIIVHEGKMVDGGRLETALFSFRTKFGLEILEEVTYNA